MAPLLACLLLAHALAGGAAFPLTPERRAALPPGLARCLWAGDGECDEPELCRAGSDAADCGALLGEASTSAELNRRATQEMGAEEVNVALGKATTQSSEGWGGVSSRAVDGNRDTNFNRNSCTHTNNGEEEWWQVDLGASYLVESVNIWHRSDGDTAVNRRLLGATVVVSDTNDFHGAAATRCGPVDDHRGEPDETQCNARGRYVTVEHHNEYLTILSLIHI